MKHLLSILALVLCPFASSGAAQSSRAVHEPRLAPMTLTMPNDQVINVVGGTENSAAADPADTALTNSWTSGGEAVKVETKRSANETIEKQVERHVKAVKLMRAAFPADVQHDFSHTPVITPERRPRGDVAPSTATSRLQDV